MHARTRARTCAHACSHAPTPHACSISNHTADAQPTPQCVAGPIPNVEGGRHPCSRPTPKNGQYHHAQQDLSASVSMCQHLSAVRTHLADAQPTRQPDLGYLPDTQRRRPRRLWLLLRAGWHGG
eukprot:183206-Chlamydomonas_euryale.AAC.1